MNNLLLHALTEKRLKKYLMNPGHSVCLIGLPGAGKSFLAHQIAIELLQGQRETAIKTVSPEKSSIGIEAIRDLQKFLKLKAPGQNSIRRVVIIENAEQMTIEAQNALLKTLEEPAEDTALILTCSNPQDLLPTVRSRTNLLKVLSPDLTDAISYFNAFTSIEVSKAYHMSDGSIGLMTALLNNKEHPLVEAIDASKRLLANTSFQRLISVDDWAKDKENLKQLLFGLKRLLAVGLAAENAKTTKLAQALKSVYEAEKALQGSTNVKLLLTDLFLRI